MLLQIAAGALAVAALSDGISTVNMLRRGFVEQNPLFGSNPSTLRVFGEGAAIIGLEIFSGLYLSRLFSPAAYIVFVCMATQATVHINRAIHNFRLK